MMFKTAAPLLLLSIAAAAPAQAGDFKFQFARSELETPAGVEALYDRIEERAERACVNRDRTAIWQAGVEEKCVETVIAEIVEKIDDARLAAVHETAQGASKYAQRD
jgi:UrcA family protein